MIEQNKLYEIKYWLNQDKAVVLNTYKKFFEIVPIGLFSECTVAADIGCGAYGGIFNEVTFPVMYGVDPMWGEYVSNGLVPCDDVKMVTANASNKFEMSQIGDLDCVFSINALDHSGDFNKSIENIYDSLKDGGLFAMHVQLKTEEQLDIGHMMAIDTDKIMNSGIRLMHRLFLNEYVRCPFGNQNKAGKCISAIIGVWKK